MVGLHLFAAQSQMKTCIQVAEMIWNYGIKQSAGA